VSTARRQATWVGSRLLLYEYSEGR